MQPQTIGKIAAILGTLAVILGALAAHALKTKLPPEQLSSFETAVKYQFYHALTLLFIYLIYSNHPNAYFLQYAVWLFTFGVLFFSGSIYLLSTRLLWGMENKLTFLGPITPIGGLMMITGWIFLFLHFSKKNKN
jgi:uncharacterized membrane protein YgdD (TMEM256/DUF423 family)